MTFINELRKYTNDNNICYVDELIDIIAEEKIKKLQDLKKYEEKYNNMSMEESVNHWISIIDQSAYEYDGLLYDQIQKLKEERKLMEEGQLDSKILHIIKYYYLTNRYNPYPYHTYMFIINGKL